MSQLLSSYRKESAGLVGLDPLIHAGTVGLHYVGAVSNKVAMPHLPTVLALISPQPPRLLSSIGAIAGVGCNQHRSHDAKQRVNFKPRSPWRPSVSRRLMRAVSTEPFEIGISIPLLTELAS